MLMAYRVSEHALEFNQYFVREVLGASGGNEQHLALAQRALRDILAQDLTDRQKEILLHYYYDGMTEQEIAQALAVNKSTISRTLDRARQRIRKHMRFYFDYTDFPLDG
ncbi:MAG: sigma-70 family RNA polymerase sigma factor [Ruminococcus sp.]|jgi:RNA polymerase sigma factor (sigma-70 family)|nr:sigma-70 family RNA polymerase sigma factor [Ruminococcus sp.]